MSTATRTNRRRDVVAAEGLFTAAVAAQLARLSESSLGVLLPGEKVVDLFCGGGGWTASPRMRGAGIHADYAVNHSPTAIAIHRQNNPGCVHHQGDAWKAKPLEIVPHDPVGLLLASAACTTHSNARGSAPISPRVHMLGWCIARWIREKRPRVVIIENVPEWQKWGPLVPKLDKRRRVMRDPDTGKRLLVADPTREGQHYRRFIRYCRKLGYAVEFKVLDAADYGSPSRRKRLFVIMRRDGAPIVWPEPTHGPGTGRRYRAAAEIIDWRDLGSSIWEGKRNKKSWGGTRLAEKSIKRLCEGVARFVLEEPEPFTLRVTHGEGRGWKVNAVGDPLATCTTRQDFAFVTPVIAKNNTFEGNAGSAIDDVLGTVTTHGHNSALIAPVLATTRNGEREGQRPRCNPVTDLANTVVNGATQGVGIPVMVAQRNHASGSSPLDPAAAIVAGGNHNAIGTPVLFGTGGAGYAGKPVPADQPAKTVMRDDRRAVATPIAVEYYGNGQPHSVEDSLGCIPTVDRHGIASPCMVSDLAPAMVKRAKKVGALLRRVLGDRVTLSAEGFALAVVHGVQYIIVDILFRMLRAAELALAMGFPPAYSWPTNQRDTVQLIGNAVQVDQAESLVFGVLPGMRRGGRRAAV